MGNTEFRQTRRSQRNWTGMAMCAAWLLACCVAAAQTGSLRGRLTDLHSRPAAGATVVLRNSVTGTEFRAVTSASGSYHFDKLTPGDYLLRASAPALGQGEVGGIVISAAHEARVTAALDFSVTPAPSKQEPTASIALTQKSPQPVPPAPPQTAPPRALQDARALPDSIQTGVQNVPAGLEPVAVQAALLMPQPVVYPAPSSAGTAAPESTVAVIAAAADPWAVAPAAPAIETASNPLLQQPVITGEELESLPLKSRNWSEFTGRGTDPAPQTDESADDTPQRSPAATARDGVLDQGSTTRNHPGENAIGELRTVDASDPAIRDASTGQAGQPFRLETRSGGEALHGQVFLFNRQNVWGARNPFTQWLKESSPATRGTVPQFTAIPYSPGDQRLTWGGGLGGSMPRRHLFWFASFDGDQRNDPSVSTVKHPENFFAQPSNDEMQALSARLRLSPANPVAEGLQAYSGVLESLAGLLGPAPRTSSRWSGFARLDARAGERHRFSLEANAIEWNSPGGGFSRASQTYGTHSLGSPTSSAEVARVRWESFLSPNLLATTVGELRRLTFSPQPEAPSTFEAGLLANLWGQLPQIIVDSRYGVTIGNPARFGVGTYPQQRDAELEERLDWVHGKLLLKVGFDLSHNAGSRSMLRNHYGTYVYSRVENFASDLLSFEKFGLTGALDPQQQHGCDQRGRAWRDSAGQLHGLGYLPCYSYYTQTLGPTHWQLSTNDWAGWMHAQWQPARSVVVSAALRWDRQEVPRPIALVNNPDLPETQTAPALGNQWGPRASLAWGLRESHWPVLKIGYGTYYARTSNAVLQNVLTQTGSLKGDLRYFVRPGDNLSGGDAPPFPYVFAGLPGSVEKPGAVEFAPRFKDGEVHQGEVTLEESLPGHILLSVSAQASLGRRLPMVIDRNVDPVTNPGTITYAVVDASHKGPIRTPQITVPFFASWASSIDHGRVLPQYQQVSELQSRANSTYEALQVRLARAVGRGVTLRARYTHGQAWDWNPDESSAVVGSTIFDPTNLALEYGRSDLDVRHSASGWLSWSAGKSLRNERWWRNGWRASAIGQYRSGLPYTMRTAGALPHFSTATGTLIAGLGPSMNGYGGDNRVYGVPRNTYRSPGAWKADVRAGRTFRLGHERDLELLAESFNLFNHQNVTQIETVGYYYSPGNAAGSLPTLNFMTGMKTGQVEFGQPMNVNATEFYRERQIDFGLRLRFRIDPEEWQNR